MHPCTFIAEGVPVPPPNRTGPSRYLQLSAPPDAAAPVSAGLNPRYTFDTFIVGSIQPVRTRGLPGGGGGTVAFL